MTRVAVLGATGYTALELIKILLRHPKARIAALTSRQEGNRPVASVHPQLAGRLDLPLEDLLPDEIADRAEFVFSCLPHGASAAVVGPLVDRGVRVIDFSADYRLDDAGTFATWYGQEPADPQRLGDVPYGLPELFRPAIAVARLVANPGCYPTSACLALAPLLKADLIETDGMIVDSKSGVSGAGRTPGPTTHFPECNESLAAYNVGHHRHTPEIDQTLSKVAAERVEVVFTPHLVPMDRGILTTAYARPTGDAGQDKLHEELARFYADAPFVRVVERLPATKDTVGTNFCDIAVRRVRDRVVVVSCLDNLVKGAAGQAVQNFNLLYGYDETMALLPV